MPPICSKNNLELPKIPQCFKELTNLEKQFIVKNLVFMKIRNLPKTGLQALNDRVINVPIQDENIAKVFNILPRSESNSGMVNVKLKRKMKMKNYHKAGLIAPIRIDDCLNYLVKNHASYKNIKIEKEEIWKKQCPDYFSSKIDGNKSFAEELKGNAFIHAIKLGAGFGKSRFD